ncbi:MAG: hypothetical protein WBK75_03595 [Acutalibacteraceae bacterium]|jgi:hypothetical protein|nr:hypothetical protein [Clostridiales bacterium]
MINASSVYNRLCEITTLDSEGAATCLPLCAEVAVEFSEKLRCASDEANPAVIYAAATTAYYRYMLLKCLEDGGVIQFKAGDVTVTKSVNCVMDAVQKIKKDALIAATPFFEDDGFVFKQVEI